MSKPPSEQETEARELTLIDQFVVAFDIWAEARPYLHLFVDEQEMALVVAMQGRSMTRKEISGLLGMGQDETAEFLWRCYARHIVNKTVEEGITVYTASSFPDRLDHFAKFEAWDEIPAADRRAMDYRFLDEFVSKHRHTIEQRMKGEDTEDAVPNDAILLLNEVEEMIDAASQIIVQPCDCRRLGQNCDRPVETCIWMDALALESLDRGIGRRLSREEAKELVRWADKQGLMHTGDASALLSTGASALLSTGASALPSTGNEARTRGLGVICNCCACDCYPFRAAQELGSKGVWPRSRYVARHDAELCNLCGACVKRCHFDAFYHDGTTVEIDGKARKNVVYDPQRCWGCGLCANTCPSQAIVMQPCT
jgi:ferredoxin